jgi:hypothetical protein
VNAVDTTSATASATESAPTDAGGPGAPQ